ncbi:MAG TPA: gamma-glutamylcyclotransferase family protein [Azospirillaceae bacterium]|nr:gamma-glutamylcyclotransferase family protein [Azospirillaceae bacterium]
MRLFCYGTLMDPDVRALVLGRACPEAVPARLAGWRRVRVPGEAYPVVMPDPLGSVAGLLVRLEGEAELDRVRFFEGVSFRLRQFPVESLGGGTKLAWVAAPAAEHPSEEGPWDLGLWSPHREAYLAATAAYMAAYGTVDVAEIHLVWQAHGNGRAQPPGLAGIISEAD